MKIFQIKSQTLAASFLLLLTTGWVVPPLSAAEEATEAPSIKSSELEKKNIETLLQNLSRDWNSHNIDAVMGYYADDYLNNDGFDKKTVQELTKDFWKEYPDAKSNSQTKEIRVEGPFGVIDSRDTTTGTTAKEMVGLGTKGELVSKSEGQLYLKQQGGAWKIIGDRIDYEKIKVTFGLARQLEPVFAAPEQVKAGKQFSAKLELDLPAGLTAMGSITNASVQYPTPRPPDVWKFMTDPAAERPLLERVMTANTKNRNELLMATVGLTNASRNSLMGVAILTRRLNVVPVMEEEPKTEAAKAGTAQPEPKSNNTKIE
ncbi:MAG: ester cyclase [Candidatus Obscuribacterales bacterium]|nr:ester cyclase [Candidatus Obscuribacterales bacterium]